MKKVKTNIFTIWLQFPPVIQGEFTPEFVHEFEAQGNMPKHFAMKKVKLIEATLRVGVFPELAAVVKEDSSYDKVASECVLYRAHSGGTSHHLGDMFDQSASSGMVISPGRSGATEAFAKLGNEFVI